MKRLFVLLISLLLLSGISMAQKVEIRDLEPFSDIVLTGGMNVYMYPADEEKVEISLEGEVELEDVITETDKTELKIKIKGNLFGEPEVTVKLYYKTCNSLEANGAAKVQLTEELKQNHLELASTSGGFITGKVNVEHLEAKAYQGAQLELSGTAEQLDAYVNTGGVLSATELSCEAANMQMNTGGKAEITVNKKLTGKVNTGANFSYFGMPEETDISTSLGGQISAWDEEEK